MDREEVEINMTKKDLTLRIFMQEENEDLEEEITHLIRNFKRFLKKKVRATSSIRQ